MQAPAPAVARVSRVTAIRNAGIIGVVLIWLGVGCWHLVRTTNEIGPLGTDKVGRQVFIQTWDPQFQRMLAGVRVTSEWEDTTFLWRFVVQEPMRTTLRFVLAADQPAPEPQASRMFLDRPYQMFLDRYAGPVQIQQDSTRSPAEIDERLRELGARTNEDFFAAMGFRRFEVYHGSALVVGYDLKEIGRPNVKHAGGD